MAVSTKSKKSPARSTRKVAAKVEMSESRKAARERNVESRKRAEAEAGAKPNAKEVVVYSLKNRKTGEVRILIDARGDGSKAQKPWLVRNPETGAEVGFATRKDLGKNYAHVDLSGSTAKPKARARRVAAKK